MSRREPPEARRESRLAFAQRLLGPFSEVRPDYGGEKRFLWLLVFRIVPFRRNSQLLSR
jgi:hypothetical protein